VRREPAERFFFLPVLGLFVACAGDLSPPGIRPPSDCGDPACRPGQGSCLRVEGCAALVCLCDPPSPPHRVAAPAVAPAVAPAESDRQTYRNATRGVSVRALPYDLDGYDWEPSDTEGELEGPPAPELELVFGHEALEERVQVATGFSGCESIDTVVEGVPKLDDDRLALAQLFCERGADVFSRDILTTLVFLGDDEHEPAVLWQGEGEFRNEFDACEVIDVPYVERGASDGKIRVMQHHETLRYEGGDIPPEDGCIAEPRRNREIGVIEVPRPPR
jgi:hypothetical protein